MSPARDFKPTPSQKASETAKGFKRLAEPESLEDTLAKTNPHRGDPRYSNNCTLCSIAAFLRQVGYDVTAGNTGGKQKSLGGIVEECFKGAKVFDGSAGKFGRSQKDAAEMLLKRYGANAKGVCGIQWKGTIDGHAFNWKIKDGVVSFFDTQTGNGDISRYWREIDPNGYLTLARLDGLEIDLDAISEYLEMP